MLPVLPEVGSVRLKHLTVGVSFTREIPAMIGNGVALLSPVAGQGLVDQYQGNVKYDWHGAKEERGYGDPGFSFVDVRRSRGG